LKTKVEPIEGQKIASSTKLNKTILNTGVHLARGGYWDGTRYCDREERPNVYKARSMESKKRPNADKQEKNKEAMLKMPQYLLLISPMLAGFSLKEKKWRKLSHPSIFARTEC
jgi:hypothetical protein